MPLVGVKANAGAFGLGWSAVLPAETLGGMVLLTPTSVDITGGGSETATTLANGSVEFTACGTVSLNGVFSADYDNYMVAVRYQNDTTNANLDLRLRASGSDNSTANSYTNQYLFASSTTVNGQRYTDSKGLLNESSNTQRDGLTLQLYGPYLTQPTAIRSVTVNGRDSARIIDTALTHNQSTSYDGFTFIPASSTISGLISVFGLVGA